MDKKQRLTGIDLLRGLAIYAVVILHSDEGILFEPIGWAAILQFSSFAVPFFLATSFYLIFNKISISGSQFTWKSRLTRLLIPYGIWSLVYIIQKSIKYLVKHENDKLVHLFQDPVSMIFFGGAAFHLYFLPLLLSGTLLIKFAYSLFQKRFMLQNLMIFFLISTIVYEVLLLSGNSFQIGSSIAFQKFLESAPIKQNLIIRIFLDELALLIRCLPYIFMAMILNNKSISKKISQFNTSSTIVLFLIFVTVNFYGNLFIPEALYEVGRGYTTLLFAISLSTNLKENHIIANLGSCSFGIYLIHLLVVEVFQSIEKRIYDMTDIQVSVFSLLTFSIVSFIISWMATYLLMKNKSISKVMFGV